MSLYGMMRTSVSGMNGQANRLAAVADNIANADTTGYKRRDIEFSTLIVPGRERVLHPGGIVSHGREAVSAHGVLESTASATDLAIDGHGFFVVRDSDGGSFLTRAGAFVPDETGRMVNVAGFALAGIDLAAGGAAAPTDMASLTEVRIDRTALVATPSTAGTLTVNLPSAAPPLSGPTPAANVATSGFTSKSSLVTYDNLGGAVTLDLYFAKTAPGVWEASAFDRASAATAGGFPYAAGPLATATLAFDPASGRLAAGSPAGLAFTVPDGRPFALDLSGSTQLAAPYELRAADADGHPPSAVSDIVVSEDGTISALHEDGTLRALYRIPLATVMSPDRLTGLAGNVWAPGPDSGDVAVGFAGEGGRGLVVSGALESSNVELADELTSMIQSQRGYTANSRVFQTGADLMDIIVNLKR